MKTQWDLPESPKNLYCVEQKQWAKWPNAARALFNDTMDATYDHDDVVWGLAMDSAADWRAIRWNIALTAANRLARMLKAPRGGA
jgi:hypothetical protein